MESKLKRGHFIVDEILPALYASNMVLVSQKENEANKEIIENNKRVIGLIKEEFKEELDLDFFNRFGFENPS